ncbi:MAG: fixL [Gammaproteobacteria bacterium]|jgi:two-component system sensor kinase FixL|nr:fixL [Gammaproteobacteria bacterium]
MSITASYSKLLLSLSIYSIGDVAHARQRARQIASLLGFDIQKQIHIATAVSEIARNACMHAKNGSIEYLIHFHEESFFLKIIVLDEGPGIKELETILTGISRTGKGKVFGITGTKNLVDDFKIVTNSETGTQVFMEMRFSSDMTAITTQKIADIANALVKYQPTDASREAQQQNKELLHALELLKEAHEKLDQRVEERTRELTSSNEKLEKEIEEHVLSKRLLQNVSERLNLALQASHAGTWSYNVKEDHFIIGDEYMSQLLEINNKALVYSHDDFLNRVHEEDRERVKNEMEEVIGQKKIYDCDYRIRLRDNTFRFLSARGKIYSTSSHADVLVTGICWDITQRKKMEAWFYQHAQELSKIERINTMGEMASTLSHELNQPLASIASYVEGCIRRLKSKKFDMPAIISALEETVSQVERSGEIIHRMKNFIRQGVLTYEYVDINLLIEETIRLVRQELSGYSNKIKIVHEKNDSLPVIKVDRIQIQQVFLNLLRNAAQTVDQNKISFPLVSIKTEKMNNQFIKVMVIDNGPGILKEHEARLFEPYFTTKKNGMGIGLAICRTIIEAHRGHLFFLPVTTGGAEFYFILPINEDERI